MNPNHPQSPDPGNEILISRIRSRIQTEGCITFAEFMDMALYDPEHGYYTSGREPIGPEGDYLTCPTLHPAFGATIARWLAKTWQQMGSPDPFDILEIGAGKGLLREVIQASLRENHPDTYHATHYRTIEKRGLHGTEVAAENPPLPSAGEGRGEGDSSFLIAPDSPLPTDPGEGDRFAVASAPGNHPAHESSSPFTERRWPKAEGEVKGVSDSSPFPTPDSPLTTDPHEGDGQALASAPGNHPTHEPSSPFTERRWPKAEGEVKGVPPSSRLSTLDSPRATDFPPLTTHDSPLTTLSGVIISNELIDAFPIHLVTVDSGLLKEIYVAVSGDRFIEEFHQPSTPEIGRYFERLGITLPEGYRTEVNLRALDWMKQIASILNQGCVLTIDYGYTADQYYSPERRRGTLLCYHQHTYHEDPYIHIGQQDITAHVDFTSLMEAGHAAGLETITFTTQREFLLENGIQDHLATSTNRRPIMALIDPRGMGNFRVLIQRTP